METSTKTILEKKFDDYLIDNIDHAALIINPKIFPMDIIFSASYILLDKAYIILDGDPATQVIVKIRAKSSKNHRAMAEAFYDQLYNYQVYKQQADASKEIRKSIIQRALLTNGYGDNNE